MRNLLILFWENILATIQYRYKTGFTLIERNGTLTAGG
jgi:hypothetical protein